MLEERSLREYFHHSLLINWPCIACLKVMALPLAVLRERPRAIVCVSDEAQELCAEN